MTYPLGIDGRLPGRSEVALLVRGDTMRVVICGGGVIGACTAYYLSLRGIDVIVVERTEVAAAASGKAGASWRSTGAPAPRLMRWRGEVSGFTLPCPVRLRAIGATAG